MNTSQGIVNLITEKPLDNGGTMYSFKLESGEWFGLGFTKPDFTKGAFIEFAWTAKGKYKNADPASVTVKDAPLVAATAATDTKVAQRSLYNAGATNWDEKDKRITMLACRKDAVEMVKIAIETGALKLGTKNKQEILLDSINKIAGELYYGIYGEDFPLNTRATVAEETVNDEE